MIELGDPENLGYVEINNFMELMKEIGLTKQEN